MFLLMFGGGFSFIFVLCMFIFIFRSLPVFSPVICKTDKRTQSGTLTGDIRPRSNSEINQVLAE